MVIGSTLEDRLRAAVKARLRRGERDECAAAAGHKGPWLSKWMHGDQGATLDELTAITKFLHVPMMKVIQAGDLDLHDVALFGKIQSLPERSKTRAVRFVDRLAAGADDIVVPRSVLEEEASPRRTARKVAGKRRGV